MRWFCQTFPSIDKRVCLSEVLTFLHLPTVIVFRFEKASAKKNLLRKVTKCRGNSVFLPRVSGDNANQISPSKFGILLLNSIQGGSGSGSKESHRRKKQNSIAVHI